MLKAGHRAEYFGSAAIIIVTWFPVFLGLRLNEGEGVDPWDAFTIVLLIFPAFGLIFLKDIIWTLRRAK